jgi:hypothetical protein
MYNIKLFFQMRKIIRSRRETADEKRRKNDIEIWRQQIRANSIGFDERLTPYQPNVDVEENRPKVTKTDLSKALNEVLTSTTSSISTRYR